MTIKFSQLSKKTIAAAVSSMVLIAQPMRPVNAADDGRTAPLDDGRGEGVAVEQRAVLDSERMRIDRDANGRVVIVYDGNATLLHPRFSARGETMEVFLRKGAGVGELESGKSSDGLPPIEKIVLTGPEVRIDRVVAEGDKPEIGKCRRATYYPVQKKFTMELWPQYQRGRAFLEAEEKACKITLIEGKDPVLDGNFKTSGPASELAAFSRKGREKR